MFFFRTNSSWIIWISGNEWIIKVTSSWTDILPIVIVTFYESGQIPAFKALIIEDRDSYNLIFTVNIYTQYIQKLGEIIERNKGGNLLIINL